MTTAAPTFKIALVRMRSGVHPDANLAAALAAIDEAARAGAADVLTPEMTTIMGGNRERLFATIPDEDHDPTLAALREAGRRHAMFVHAGSLAIKLSADRAANRSFLIDRDSGIDARYA